MRGGETSSHTVEGQRKCGFPQNQLPTAMSKPWEEEDETDLSWYHRYLSKCPYFDLNALTLNGRWEGTSAFDEKNKII